VRVSREAGHAGLTRFNPARLALFSEALKARPRLFGLRYGVFKPGEVEVQFVAAIMSKIYRCDPILHFTFSFLPHFLCTDPRRTAGITSARGSDHTPPGWIRKIVRVHLSDFSAELNGVRRYGVRSCEEPLLL
jgi:hypothetical protein